MATLLYGKGQGIGRDGNYSGDSIEDEIVLVQSENSI